jgi:hypothetical protein
LPTDGVTTHPSPPNADRYYLISKMVREGDHIRRRP